jgi:hypothetical protein
MARASSRITEWGNLYVAVFKCFRRSDRSAEKNVDELLVADGAGIESDPDLRRVVQALQTDLVSKPFYRYAQNPTTRFLGFRTDLESPVNEGQRRLNGLLQARSILKVRTQAAELAQHYMGISGVREGILVFVVSEPRVGPKALERCAFVFKCDFEAVSQIRPGELFHRVEDAIIERTQKGALYPSYYRGHFDDTAVRVFDAFGETQYWLDFLDLGERREYKPLKEVAIDQVSIDYPEIAQKYSGQFGEVATARSLADGDRIVERADRLSTRQVAALTETITARADRKQTIRLKLDETNITAPLDQYGKTWIIAEEGDERYLLVKGSDLESRTTTLTPIDLARFGSLREAADELNIAWT